MSRRIFLLQSSAAAFSTLTYSERAQSDPYVIASLVSGVLASVISGLVEIIGRGQESRIALEDKARSLMINRTEYLFDKLPLNEQLLMYKNGTYYNALVNGNFDGFGSSLEFNNGRLFVTRNGTGGFIHSDMAVAMGTVRSETRIAPVPTGNIRAADSDRFTTAGAEFLADNMGLSGGADEYLEKYPPKMITMMSLAKQPKNSPDFAFFTTLNNQKTVDIGGGKLLKAVNVNAVPINVLA